MEQLKHLTQPPAEDEAAGELEEGEVIVVAHVIADGESAPALQRVLNWNRAAAELRVSRTKAVLFRSMR